jgi:hypothetical protein
MTIQRALKILKNKNDYIVPNSDMDEAIQNGRWFYWKYIRGGVVDGS